MRNKKLLKKNAGSVNHSEQWKDTKAEKIVGEIQTKRFMQTLVKNNRFVIGFNFVELAIHLN